MSILESKKGSNTASLTPSLLFYQASYQVCCFLLDGVMMLPWMYLNPDSHELILVLMVLTISLITKQSPLFVRASDNRVPRLWSMINLTFCTCCAPLNSGRGLLILSSLSPSHLLKGILGLGPRDLCHSAGVQSVGSISRTLVILIISCIFPSLPIFFFYFASFEQFWTSDFFTL